MKFLRIIFSPVTILISLLSKLPPKIRLLAYVGLIAVPAIFLTLLVYKKPKTYRVDEPIFSDTKYLRLVKKNLVNILDAPGTVSQIQKAQITSLANARMASFAKDVGDFVAKGEVIAMLDKQRLEMEHLQAQNSVNSATAQLRLSKEKYTVARRNVEKRIWAMEKEKIDVLALKAKFDNDLINEKAKKTLLDIDGVTPLEYNAQQVEIMNTKSRYYGLMLDQKMNAVGYRVEDLLKAGFQRPKTKLEWKKMVMELNTTIERSELNIAEAGIKSAEAQEKISALLLKEATIRSPIDGVIAARQVDIGEMVKADTPIFVVVGTNPVYLVTSVSEENLFQIKKGLEVKFSVDALPGKAFTGIVTVISPVLAPQTRTAEVKIKANNPEHIFRPGMFVRTQVVLAAKVNAMAIPETAIVITDRKPGKLEKNAYCFVLKEGSAFKKEIVIGNRYNDEYEILKGLSQNDIVATSNVEALNDGLKVYSEERWKKILAELSKAAGTAATSAPESADPDANQPADGDDTETDLSKTQILKKKTKRTRNKVGEFQP